MVLGGSYLTMHSTDTLSIFFLRLSRYFKRWGFRDAGCRGGKSVVMEFSFSQFKYLVSFTILINSQQPG